MKRNLCFEDDVQKSHGFWNNMDVSSCRQLRFLV